MCLFIFGKVKKNFKTKKSIMLFQDHYYLQSNFEKKV